MTFYLSIVHYSESPVISLWMIIHRLEPIVSFLSQFLIPLCVYCFNTLSLFKCASRLFYSCLWSNLNIRYYVWRTESLWLPLVKCYCGKPVRDRILKILGIQFLIYEMNRGLETLLKHWEGLFFNQKLILTRCNFFLRFSGQNRIRAM